MATKKKTPARAWKKAALIAALVLAAFAVTAYAVLFYLPGRQLAQADALLAQGDAQGAREGYEQLAQAALPGGLRLSALPLGAYREAAARLPQADYALGEALREQGDFAQAAEAFARAGGVDGAQAALAYCLGRAAQEQKDYETAARYFAQAADYADARAQYTRSNEAAITALLAAPAAPAAPTATAEPDTPDAPDAPDTPDAADGAPRAAHVRVGDTVRFGRYEQDGEAGNGPEPLTWRVLAVEEDALMLLCEQIVDCQPYHDGFMVATWESCSLREWLNRTFYRAAFDETERSALMPAPAPEESARFAAAPDATAGDLVTLLSRDALSALLPDAAGRAAQTTAYAQACGAAGGAWWLRMDGYESDDAAVAGGERVRSVYVNTQGVGVRPVVWARAAALE